MDWQGAPFTLPTGSIPVRSTANRLGSLAQQRGGEAVTLENTEKATGRHLGETREGQEGSLDGCDRGRWIQARLATWLPNLFSADHMYEGASGTSGDHESAGGSDDAVMAARESLEPVDHRTTWQPGETGKARAAVWTRHTHLSRWMR
jgi:hypothetical protein